MCAWHCRLLVRPPTQLRLVSDFFVCRVIAGNPARVIKQLDPADPNARKVNKKFTTA